MMLLVGRGVTRNCNYIEKYRCKLLKESEYMRSSEGKNCLAIKKISE
jgi:hypothetical protein